MILFYFMLLIDLTKKTFYNSHCAKAGVSCLYDSEVINSSFVYLMKFSAKNPRLRKAVKRYLLSYKNLV